MYLIAWVDRRYRHLRGMLSDQYGSEEEAEEIIVVRKAVFPHEECRKVEFPDWAKTGSAPVAEAVEKF